MAETLRAAAFFAESSNESKKEVKLAEETRDEHGDVVKDYHYYFRHPWSRLFVAGFIVWCNFLILAEDPVAHSKSEANIPLIGNAYTFIFARYPDNGGVVFAKIVLWVLSLAAGMFVGRNYIHHKLLRDRLKVSFFSPGTDNGTWMVMLFTSILFLAFGSVFYNVMFGTDSTNITPFMDMRNSTFYQAAACGTWFGDAVTVFMVLDMMLQTTEIYADWLPGPRRWWVGSHRIWAFWIVLPCFSALVVTLITTSAIDWDESKPSGLETTEVSRALLASFITALDLMIVAADWEFPMFDSGQEVKIMGAGFENFDVKLRDVQVTVTGKWFNYGIIFVVMLLDMNMLKNQVIYVPYMFGQYTDPEGYIFTTSDVALLNLVDTDLPAAELALTWENRQAFALNGTDERMATLYKDVDGVALFFCVLPALASIAFFVHLARGERSTAGKSKGMLKRAALAVMASKRLVGSGAGAGAGGDEEGAAAAQPKTLSLGTTAASKQSAVLGAWGRPPSKKAAAASGGGGGEGSGVALMAAAARSAEEKKKDDGGGGDNSV